MKNLLFFIGIATLLFFTSCEKEQPIVPSFETLITANEGGLVSPLGRVSTLEGGKLKIEITPNAGFDIDSIFVDGHPKSEVSNQLVFQNINSKHKIDSVRVVFAKNTSWYLMQNEWLLVSVAINDTVYSGNEITPHYLRFYETGMFKTFSFPDHREVVEDAWSVNEETDPPTLSYWGGIWDIVFEGDYLIITDYEVTTDIPGVWGKGTEIYKKVK